LSYKAFLTRFLNPKGVAVIEEIIDNPFLLIRLDFKFRMPLDLIYFILFKLKLYFSFWKFNIIL